jgi:perosamine synthetase
LTVELLPKMLEIKAEAAARYGDFIAGQGVRFVDAPQGTISNFWLNATVLGSEAERDAFLECTNAQDVMARPIWRLMSRPEMFKDCQHDGLGNSRRLEKRVVNLPSSVPESEFGRLKA